MTLAEVLSIPYVLEAQSVETAAGVWLRQVAYPEIPGCRAAAAQLEDAVDEVERLRIDLLLEGIYRGQLPPSPREPLVDAQPASTLLRVGYPEAAVALLDLECGELAGHETLAGLLASRGSHASRAAQEAWSR